MEQRKVIVVASSAERRRVRVLVRWLHALLPAAALIVTAPDAGPGIVQCDDEDSIVVDADALPSGPLSLADTLVRAAAAGGNARSE